MQKRISPYGGWEDQWQDPKRLHVDAVPDAGMGMAVEAEYYIEQHLVGYVLGRGGSACRDLESQYQVKLSMDQATKSEGYSKLKIVGSESAVSKASEAINLSLARADSATSGGSNVGPFLLDAPPVVKRTDFTQETMQVEQQYIGWLVGKSGGVVREIEERAGCKVLIDQSTKTMGYSTLQFLGAPDQVASAMGMVTDSIQRAKASSPTGTQAFNAEDQSQQVDQAHVGWLLGKGGGLIKEIQEESGCRITFDQSTREMGYSTIHYRGDRNQIAAARRRIDISLQSLTSGGGSRGGGDAAMQVQLAVDQTYVGYLVGRSGSMIQEIQSASGATISMNQDTKEQGYSVATIKGNFQQTNSAQEIIAAKLRQACPTYDVKPPTFVLDSEPSPGGGALPKGGGRGSGQPRTFNSEFNSFPAPNSHANYNGNSTGSYATVETELQIEQGCVGWIVGKNWVVKKEIEAESGASLSFDQSTKELGFSTVKISGTQLQVGEASRIIHQKVARADPSRPSSSRVTVVSDGSGGGQAGSQEAADDLVEAYVPSQGRWFPAKVLTRHSDGAVTVRWADGRTARLLGENVQRAASPPVEDAVTPGVSDALPGPTPVDDTEMDLQIEQRVVPWVIGKSGAVLKEIETMSGAGISIDQTTKEMGFSTVHSTGTFQQRMEANRLIMEKIAQVESPAPGASAPPALAPSTGGFDFQAVGSAGGASDEVQIEQRMVGWVLGQRGVVLKEIEAASGARISIDQSTRGFGYSTARINGGEAEVASARQLIQEKISMAGPGGGKGGGCGFG